MWSQVCLINWEAKYYFSRFVNFWGNKKKEMQALGFLAQANYKSDELEQAELNFKKR